MFVCIWNILHFSDMKFIFSSISMRGLFSCKGKIIRENRAETSGKASRRKIVIKTNVGRTFYSFVIIQKKNIFYAGFSSFVAIPVLKIVQWQTCVYYLTKDYHNTCLSATMCI